MPHSRKTAKDLGGDWIEIEQSAAIFGVSRRAVDIWISEGKIRKIKGKLGSTGHPRTLVSWEDVERLYVERNPDAPPITMPKPGAKVQRIAGVPMATAAPVPISEKILLTLPEAAELSGLRIKDIQDLIEAKDLPSVQTGAGLRVRRRDVERLFTKL